MKKILIIAMVLCGLLTFAGSSWATPITYTVNSGATYVGELDTWVASTVQQGGIQAEVDWINLVLGTNYQTDAYTKYETDEGAGWKVTNTANVVAFDLNSDTDYFIVKTGKNNNTGIDYRDFLFKNNAEFDWAVIQLNIGTDAYFIKNVGKLSHIGFAGTQVPEPGMLLMFGSGLVCLGFFGRKKFRK